jgi:hypothetical protein
MCYVCEQAEQVRTDKNLPTELFWNPETRKVSVVQLADAVRRAALANPDKVYDRRPYTGCMYTHTDPETGEYHPGCIVGQGIFDLTGLPVDQDALPGAVNNDKWRVALNATTGERDSWGEVILVDDPLTRYLVDWLRIVQAQQDGGKPWGEAIAFADRTLRFASFTS